MKPAVRALLLLSCLALAACMPSRKDIREAVQAAHGQRFERFANGGPTDAE